MESLFQYPSTPMEISQYLCALWNREYSTQGISLISSHQWESKMVPIDSLQSQLPSNLSKAKKYYKLIQEGIVIMPPLVCINGEVIDGLHRYWAYKKAGFCVVKIYQNIPWREKVCA